MHEAEGINFKIVTMGREEVDTRQKSNLRSLTLQGLVKWIDKQNLDERVKAELKKAAGTYPQQALGAFRKNFSTHVSRVQKKLRAETPIAKELGDDETEEL